MSTLPFLIAQRYLFARHEEKSIATMIFICFIGIAVGTFSLALVGAIMTGFEEATARVLQSTHPSIIISAYGKQLNAPALEKVIAREFPQVRALAPRSTQYALLYTPHDEETEPLVVALMAIDPHKEAAVTSLANTIQGDSSLNTLTTTPQSIIISETMAREREIKVGDTISLWLAPTAIESKTVTFDEYPVHVVGLFNTGIDDVDNRIIITSLTTLHALFPHAGITQLGLALTDQRAEQHLIPSLRKRLNLDVYSWKELYPPIIAALNLEKYAMICIFALIVLVASTTIIALLFMWITRKRTDIAILKAMGMPERDIRRIFIMIGLTIITSAALIGISCASGISYLLDTYQVIALPDAYYIAYLPARMSWQLIATIFAIIIAVGTLALCIPLQSVSRIKVISILRFNP